MWRRWRFDDWRRILGFEATPEQARACRYLEGKGLRFLVDFGYENAIEKLSCRHSWRWR